MTDKERIERLERKVNDLEELLKEAVRLMNRLADVILKHTETHTDCPWK